jgi:hypothetical protein
MGNIISQGIPQCRIKGFVDFLCQFESVGKSLNGFVEIGKYANIELSGVKI